MQWSAAPSRGSFLCSPQESRSGSTERNVRHKNQYRLEGVCSSARRTSYVAAVVPFFLLPRGECRSSSPGARTS
jgi:hypothetical protein